MGLALGQAHFMWYNFGMDLTAEVTNVPGVGEKTAAQLEKAGIFTVRDLLYFLPRDYENFQAAQNIADLHPGKVILRGKIKNLETQYTRRRGLTITTGQIEDDTGAVRVVWFNQPYRKKQFDEEKDYYFTGSYDLKNGRYQLTSPSAVLAADIETTAAQNELHPIYPAKGGMKPAQFVRFFDKLRGQFALIPDLLPGTALDGPTEVIPEIRKTTPNFVYPGARADALYKTHFPERKTEVEEGRRYLAYEELFELILAAQLSKQETEKLAAAELKFVAENTRKLVSSLPFTLTPGQKRATWDILQDLEKKTPMNRLLQGDVGSGKTVVAAIAAFQAICSGYQAAILAPTAILAEQHKETLESLLRPLGVKIALLTGATKGKEKLKEEIRQGKIDLIIGTHALITDDTGFYNLALCVIDEQHRFGVEQRRKLLMKVGRNAANRGNPDAPTAPHLLSMTATPIPRSLQLTVFGDLDISVIKQLPKGRQPIKTVVLRETSQKEVLFPKMHEEIRAGHQVYWICRSIEENPETETVSVKKQAEKLRRLFPKYNVEFLHGRMKPAEKDEIMGRFAAGEVQILVSTTVVEVGVNVPNATLMVISDAENYGLAQLHQLRGRVGRGSEQSYCFLISTAEEPTRRLKAMEESTDGFYLAEMDLKIRGPGEIYGALQHGALDLRIATLSDTELISLAARAAKAVAAEFAKDPKCMVKYKELSAGISHYQQLTTLN